MRRLLEAIGVAHARASLMASVLAALADRFCDRDRRRHIAECESRELAETTPEFEQLLEQARTFGEFGSAAAWISGLPERQPQDRKPVGR